MLNIDDLEIGMILTDVTPALAREKNLYVIEEVYHGPHLVVRNLNTGFTTAGPPDTPAFRKMQRLTQGEAEKA